MDSEVSFEDDADEEIDTTLIEEEYIKRSTDEAMESTKIRCWNKTHKKMKWKLALRIATSPSDRWLRKAVAGERGVLKMWLEGVARRRG